MAGLGRSVLKLDVSADDTTGVLGSTRHARSASGRGLPAHYREDTNTLLILDVLCRKKSVTAGEISTVIQRDTETSEKVLRSLTEIDVALQPDDRHQEP